MVSNLALKCQATDSPLLNAVLRPAISHRRHPIFTSDEVSADVDALVDAFKLQAIRRFYWQQYWSEESQEAKRADGIEQGLKLENVAAHSWHVADAVMVLVGHFPDLPLSHCVALAVLHDKLEIYTGDYDPVGFDGMGTSTHAFNPCAQLSKTSAEKIALEQYLASLRPGLRIEQRRLLEEIIEGETCAAKFVKAVDKLQALAFVYVKKDGRMSDEHIDFTIRYSRKVVQYFPPLHSHYTELLSRVLNNVAKNRGEDRNVLDNRLFAQLELKL